MKHLIWLFFPLVFLACTDNQKHEDAIQEIELAKWYNDYQSVYTPTFDTGLPSRFDGINNWLIERDLYLDYEIVSLTYNGNQNRVDYLMQKLMPEGFGFFGHGHTHINHDKLSYDEAYASFQLNFDSMVGYGLTPVSYAYPKGAGREDSTQRALKEAGFWAGRLFQPVFEESGPYIMAYNETEPKNWFALPSLRMEDYSFNQCEECVNNTEEFLVHLKKNIKRRSWLISTYHAIGLDGTNENGETGWGYYNKENFYQEMLEVKKRSEEGKIWLANMDDVVAYTYLRNDAVISLETIYEDEFRLEINHSLDKDIFNHELTFKLRIDDYYVGNKLVVTNPEGENVHTTQIEEANLLINVHPSVPFYTLKIESN